MRIYFLELTDPKTGRKSLVLDTAGAVISTPSKRVIDEQLKSWLSFGPDPNVKIEFEEVQS